VLDPGVAKCTFGRVYSNTRVQLDTCIKIHVSDSQPRVHDTWPDYHVYHDTRGQTAMSILFCFFIIIIIITFYFLFKYNY
jgi:hypothetical protein